jgi:hypothetical protein
MLAIFLAFPVIRSSREHAPTANSCKTEYCAMSLLIPGEGHVWLEIK